MRLAWFVNVAYVEEFEMNFAKLKCKPVTEVEIDINALALWLASEKDEIQAQFFNEFDIQLRRLCSLNAGGSVAMQCHFIRKYLTRDAGFTLEDIGKT